MRLTDGDTESRRTSAIQRDEDPTRILVPWRRDRLGLALVLFELGGWVAGFFHAAGGDVVAYLIGATLAAVLGDVWLRWVRRHLRLAWRDLRERLSRL
jgi:hypothetical protein